MVIQWWFMVIHGETTRDFFWNATMNHGTSRPRCWHRCAVPYARRRKKLRLPKLGFFFFFRGISPAQLGLFCVFQQETRWNQGINIWLVVWIFFLFHSVGNKTPMWLILFQRGWNHQPDIVLVLFLDIWSSDTLDSFFVDHTMVLLVRGWRPSLRALIHRWSLIHKFPVDFRHFWLA